MTQAPAPLPSSCLSLLGVYFWFLGIDTFFMVSGAQVALGVLTVVLSVALSSYTSWKISKSELRMEYEWERYHNAEEWCDDFICLIKELQATYEYKRVIMNLDEWDQELWIPGNDLDDYGIKIKHHLAQRPVLIWNILGERSEGEVGITDNTSEIALYCGLLSDENLERYGEDAPKQINNLSDDLNESCEELIDNIMEVRNEDLKQHFKENQ